MGIATKHVLPPPPVVSGTCPFSKGQDVDLFPGMIVSLLRPLFVLSGPASAAFHEVPVEWLFLASARLGMTVVLK